MDMNNENMVARIRQQVGGDYAKACGRAMVYRDYHLGRAWIEEAAGKHQEAAHQHCMAAQMERVIALLAEEEARYVGISCRASSGVPQINVRVSVFDPLLEWQRTETW